MRKLSNRQGIAFTTVLWAVVGVVVAVVAFGVIQTVIGTLIKVGVIVIATLFVLGLLSKGSEDKIEKKD